MDCYSLQIVYSEQDPIEIFPGSPIRPLKIAFIKKIFEARKFFLRVLYRFIILTSSNQVSQFDNKKLIIREKEMST